jgi:hypothetical protein
LKLPYSSLQVRDVMKLNSIKIPKTNLQDENQESIGYFYSYQIGKAH